AREARRMSRSAWERSIGAVCLGALLALMAAGPVAARPAHLKALGEHYGSFLPAALANCATCHLPSSNRAPASLAEFPHNPFGDRLRRLGEELSAAGKRAGLPSRLR